MQITCPLFTQVGSSVKHQPPGHAIIASRSWWDPVRGGQTGKRGEASCAGQPLPCLGEGLSCAHSLSNSPPTHTHTSLCQPTHEKQTQHPASHFQAVECNPLDYEMKGWVAPSRRARVEETGVSQISGRHKFLTPS